MRLDRTIANILSWAFNPGLLLLIALMVGVGASDRLSPRAVVAWFVILAFFSVMSFYVLLAAWVRGIALDADLADSMNLANRSKVLLIFGGFLIAMLVASFRTHQAQPLHALIITVLAITVLTAAISSVWKISLHMLGAGTMVTAILAIYGLRWWPISLIIIVLAWARLMLKKHTPLQVCAGTLLGFLVTASVFYFSGLL